MNDNGSNSKAFDKARFLLAKGFSLIAQARKNVVGAEGILKNAGSQGLALKIK